MSNVGVQTRSHYPAAAADAEEWVLVAVAVTTISPTALLWVPALDEPLHNNVLFTSSAAARMSSEKPPVAAKIYKLNRFFQPFQVKQLSLAPPSGSEQNGASKLHFKLLNSWYLYRCQLLIMAARFFSWGRDVLPAAVTGGMPVQIPRSVPETAQLILK